MTTLADAIAAAHVKREGRIVVELDAEAAQISAEVRWPIVLMKIVEKHAELVERIERTPSDDTRENRGGKNIDEHFIVEFDTSSRNRKEGEDYVREGDIVCFEKMVEFAKTNGLIAEKSETAVHFRTVKSHEAHVKREEESRNWAKTFIAEKFLGDVVKAEERFAFAKKIVEECEADLIMKRARLL